MTTSKSQPGNREPLSHAWARRLPWVYAVCAALLAVLLIASPSEATLGNIVKLVYLHGALERVSVWAYAAAALCGVLLVLARRPRLAPWTQALSETALAFWVAHFIVSVPAQLWGWGGIAWQEPRVISAVWIAGASAGVYVVALWVARPVWWALSAVANFAIVVLILQNAINVLHPLNAILSSDSAQIKWFYVAIVAVSLALGAALTWDLARRNAEAGA